METLRRGGFRLRFIRVTVALPCHQRLKGDVSMIRALAVSAAVLMLVALPASAQTQWPNQQAGDHDIVTAEHRLVTEHLNVKHLRLVLGSSMGGMHSWMWGYMFPDLMDGVVPIASQPIQVSGKNWYQRRLAIEAIKHDPDWNGGNYTKNPTNYAYTAVAGFVQTENIIQIQKMAPTQAAADALYFKQVEA